MYARIRADTPVGPRRWSGRVGRRAERSYEIEPAREPEHNREPDAIGTQAGGRPVDKPNRLIDVGRMHRIAITAAWLSALFSCADDQQDDASNITVMTFNVLCSFCDDTFDPWEARLRSFHDIFERHQPDLIGLQEIAIGREVGEVFALDPEYEALFYEEPARDYPDSTLAYRRERFERLESGFFWLSPEPDRPFSKGFSPDQQVPRNVTWVRLRDRTSGLEVVLSTTHFDNNPPGQQRSAPLMVERAEAWRDAIVIVTGDFNSQPEDEAYLRLTRTTSSGFALMDSFEHAESFYADSNTEPAPAWHPEARIDHIFVGNASPLPIHVEAWHVDLFEYGPGPKFPSDHRAIAATLAIDGR